MIRWATCPICHIKYAPTDNLTSAPIVECPICRLKYAPTDNDLSSGGGVATITEERVREIVHDALEERLCALENRVNALLAVYGPSVRAEMAQPGQHITQITWDPGRRR